MDTNRRLINTPIVPGTSKPRFLTGDGKPCYGAEEEYHFRCFDLFREFGDVMNDWRDATPFRLQELEDTKIIYRKGKELGPRYGHRYDIFYYQDKVGLLQISASGVIFSELEEGTEQKVKALQLGACPGREVGTFFIPHRSSGLEKPAVKRRGRSHRDTLCQAIQEDGQNLLPSAALRP
jgi:hypothetical protein